jgi:hypothetical protein
MSRRLDGIHFDAARFGSTERATEQAQGLLGQAIGRRRLHGVDKARTGRKNDTDSASRADETDAAQLLLPTGNPGSSLDEILLDFVMPRMADPTVLRRSVSILQACISRLVPDLDGGQQLKSMAVTLIADEIERHRELLNRMQEGVES